MINYLFRGRIIWLLDNVNLIKKTETKKFNLKYYLPNFMTIDKKKKIRFHKYFNNFSS